MKRPRHLVLVSGYYGFNNLGDEAILEVLIEDLSKEVGKEEIVVLSNNPEKTEKTFGVKAIDRWHFPSIIGNLQNSRLFVSGGGGLFQDRSSVMSVFYYFLLHQLASLAKVDVVVYAQGIGPLNSPFSRYLAKLAFMQALVILVRDEKSHVLLNDWHIKSQLTADPVFLLQPTGLDQSVEAKIKEKKDQDGFLVGLSLRQIAGLDTRHLDVLFDTLNTGLPENTCLIPLVLQKEKDQPSLQYISNKWKDAGRALLEIDESQLEKPSSWLSLISRLDLVVGMRLHSLIMALTSRVPVIGLAYDPKVEAVMKEFEQPFLNLTNEISINLGDQLGDLIKASIERRQENTDRIGLILKLVRDKACKNFQVLDRILDK